MDTITKTLAKELGSRKIRVVGVGPGLVETEGTSAFIGGEFHQQILKETAVGRTGQPKDIATPRGLSRLGRRGLDQCGDLLCLRGNR